MKHLRGYILIILACVFTMANAQLTDTKKFIYIPYAYNFCLDNSGMVISVPENWGFQVPLSKDNDSDLYSIQGSLVRCSMQNNAVGKYLSVFFISPDAKTPCLELRIAAFGSDYVDDNTIISDFGKFNLTDQIDEKDVESYQHISDSEVLTFRILTKNKDEKQLCKEIIASAKSSDDLYVQLSEYRDYNGLKRNPIEYYANDSTYYPEMGFMFINKDSMNAEIRANEIVINEIATFLTAFVTLDELVDETYAGYFWRDNFNMQYTFIKREEDEDEMKSKIESYIDLSSYSKSCVQQFIYPVNELPATVYVLGHSHLPTIAVSIPTKDYIAVFIFKDNSEKELKDVEAMLSNIFVTDEHKQGIRKITDFSRKLSELVTIIPMQKRQSNYKNITLNKKASVKNIDLIACKIPSINAEILLPALSSSVLEYPSNEASQFNEKERRYNVTLKHNIEDNNYSGVYTFSDSHEEQIVLLTPINKDKISAEEYFHKQYFEYECKQEFDYIKQIGKSIIKGQTWYVMTMNDGSYVADFYITEHKGTIIEIMAARMSEGSKNNDIANKVETLLHKASFK